MLQFCQDYQATLEKKRQNNKKRSKIKPTFNNYRMCLCYSHVSFFSCCATGWFSVGFYTSYPQKEEVRGEREGRHTFVKPQKNRLFVCSYSKALQRLITRIHSLLLIFMSVPGIFMTVTLIEISIEFMLK